ncbi:MAG: lycopene beta-cyclase CrtY [Sphingomonadaceae bacterium]
MRRASRDRLLIAGGGLAGSLAALAMKNMRPEAPILVVEEKKRFGGNHIWSFFDEDVADEQRWLVEPLISHRWSGHYVAFPGHSRRMRAAYNSIRSSQLDAVMRATLNPDQYRLGERIAAVREDRLILHSGEVIEGRGAIDARGPANLSLLELGWQKFVGREYEFEKPHRVDRPVIMDATVRQLDGYRFVYLLPFTQTHLLIEDTYYSDSPELDRETIVERIEDYVGKRGFGAGAVVAEEQGVLPVALGGDFKAFWRVGGARVAKLGLRGGFFQPTTGYSLPDAVRNAVLLAEQPDFSGAALHAVFRDHATRLWRQREFYRSLNRMLFRGAPPPDRYRVLERFYRLQPRLISRFYAGRSTWLDKLKILTGRPPIPIGRALVVVGKKGRR